MSELRQFFFIFRHFRETRLCKKSRKCGKQDNHSGRCDSKREVTNRFWVHSRAQVVNKMKRDLREQSEKEEAVIAEKLARVNEKEEELKERERESKEEISRMETTREEIGEQLFLMFCCMTLRALI